MACVAHSVTEVLGPNISASKDSLQLILDCCIGAQHFSVLWTVGEANRVV